MNMTLITITNGLLRLITTSIAFFWAIHFTDIGLSGWQIGSIIAAGNITGIIFITMGGLLNDRIKSKKLISIALFVIIIQYLTISETDKFITILLLFILGGFAGTLYTISMDSIMLKTSKGHTQGKKIGWYLSLMWVGSGIGMIVGGMMLDKMDFKMLLRILSIGLGIILIFSLFLPNTKINKPTLVEYKKDLLKKDVFFFLLMIFFFATHYGAESTVYGLFLKENLGLSMGEMGLFMGGAVLTMAISVIYFSNKIKNKDKIKWVLYFGLLASGIGFIGMSIFENVVISFIGRVLHETGDVAMFVFMYFGIVKFFPVKRLGGNTGVVILTTMISGAIGAIIFGPMGESFGYHIPLIVSGSISIFAFFIAIYENKLLKHE